jgi:ubiquinone/menaquinone biosynthesis C-methylase UbiE
VNGWSLVGLLLAVLYLADAARMRRRLAALPVLAPPEPPPNGEAYVLLLAPDAKLSEPDQAAAIVHAVKQGLLAVDLLPAQWSTLPALGFAQAVNPQTYRQDRLAQGWSAGQGMLVSRELLGRAGLEATAPTDALGFLRLARALKQYAPNGCDFAVAPSLERVGVSARERFAQLRELFVALTVPMLAGQMGLFVLTAAAGGRGGFIGLLGVLALHAQPAIALSAAPFRTFDKWPTVALAWPLQVWQWLMTVAASSPDTDRAAAVERLRPAYTAELAEGPARFLERRTDRCYVCDSPKLHPLHSVTDLLQHKPGTFSLERCAACGHIFQNPRLTLEGLGLYYRDFYDGLGGAWLETIFRLSRRGYLERARAYTGEAPKRWLDVGGGYGHFSLAAKEVWPQTAFECLDMGTSADEAVRRGWADKGHRGMLPELAPTLAGQFDVVSMSHCIEHTRDPRAELAAARRVLAPGGSVVIEVPDPECVLRYVFRKWWLPYFQPQHQHLLSVKNMTRLLEENGFEVSRVQRGEAHIGSDFFFAVFLALDKWAPEDVPWAPPRGDAGRFWRAFVWSAGAPALACGAICDEVVRRLAGFPGFSNAYRVVARVKGPGDSA